MTLSVIKTDEKVAENKKLASEQIEFLEKFSLKNGKKISKHFFRANWST